MVVLPSPPGTNHKAHPAMPVQPAAAQRMSTTRNSSGTLASTASATVTPPAGMPSTSRCQSRRCNRGTSNGRRRRPPRRPRPRRRRAVVEQEADERRQRGTKAQASVRRPPRTGPRGPRREASIVTAPRRHDGSDDPTAARGRGHRPTPGRSRATRLSTHATVIERARRGAAACGSNGRRGRRPRSFVPVTVAGRDR